MDVRRRFGQIVDEAAAGERIVIERAGQPIAALVPLSDLAIIDPERRLAERLAAVDRIRRMAARRGNRLDVDPAGLVQRARRERDEQIHRAVRGRRR